MALTAKQLKERVNYIGSSDAPGVLGLSRWTTPLKVWAQKTGQIPVQDISDNLRIKLGHRLEEVVAELFEEKTGRKCRRVNETIFHQKHPFLGANIDRRVLGENAILEIKTAAAWKKKEFEGESIPQEYIIQVWHQLAVTGLPKAYLGVLIGNEDFQIKEIPRDEKVLFDLVKREVDFWKNYVVPKVMPTVITKYDAETLFELFPDPEVGSIIELGDEANIIIENLDALKADYRNLEGLIDAQENELKAMIKENETGRTSLYEIAWKKQLRNKMDLETFKKDQPDLYTNYLKKIASRVFKYKELPKEAAHVESD